MVVPEPGAIVLVRFPFSDLSQTKLRPAVILAFAGGSDWILCQVTSNPYGDARAIQLDENSFSAGSLRVLSLARPPPRSPAPRRQPAKPAKPPSIAAPSTATTPPAPQQASK